MIDEPGRQCKLRLRGVRAVRCLIQVVKRVNMWFDSHDGAGTRHSRVGFVNYIV